jgi:adenylate kinase family enzyme
LERLLSTPDLSRVVVVGTSCAGKTTLARQLAAVTGAKHIELDALHWGPNWTVRADFAERVRAAAAEPSWIIDGNYSVSRDILWPRATAIVWLNYSFALTLGRALRRTTRRVASGERLWSDNRETVRNVLFARDGVLWWVIRTHSQRRREMPILMQRPEHAHIAFIVLDSPSHAAQLVHAVTAHRRAAPVS